MICGVRCGVIRCVVSDLFQVGRNTDLWFSSLLQDGLFPSCAIGAHCSASIHPPTRTFLYQSGQVELIVSHMLYRVVCSGSGGGNSGK